MKIIHLLFSFTAGGAEILAVDLINEMCLKNEVTLIIVNDIFNEALIQTINKKVKIYYLNRKAGSKNPIPLIKLNLLLFRLKPDILHCHNFNMGDAIKLKNLNLVYTIHDVGIPINYLKKYKFLAAISDAVKMDIEARSSFKPTTIVNGINNKLFQKRTNYTLTSSEPFKIIQVSRLIHEKKGQDILINTIQIVKEKYQLNNIQLDIVGAGHSKEYLENLISTLNIEDNVHLLGEKNRHWVYQNLCNYHLLVQPSRFEGFGLTVVEGLAAGLPVLASKIDGPLEILSQTQSGFLFKNENPVDCAEKIYAIYQLYIKNDIEAIIKGSENVAESKYSVVQSAKKYLDVYKILINK